MRPSTRTLYILLFGLLLGMGLPVRGGAQPLPPPAAPDTGRVSDSSAQAASEPYATSRSVAYHVLAAPAYALHAATRPLGWAAQYVEQELPNLFKPRRPPRGAVPRIDLGGPAGLLVGLAVYDNHVLGSRHRARLEGLYGGPDTFESEALYTVPAPFGRGTRVRLAANFFSDPESNFYLNGNNSTLDADKAEFSRDQVDVAAGLRARLPDRAYRGEVELLYEHVDTAVDDATAASPAGLGTADLLTAGLTLAADFTDGPPRRSGGTALILRFDYSHDLTDDRYRYGRYVAEVRQYLPVGFLPETRRLALRGRLEQAGPLLGGTDVPFYQLPNLGGQTSLRGFRSRRFQDNGSLVLNAEYRYPIWSNVDAAVFVDAGQVFGDVADVRGNRFHWSYGGGLHVLNRNGLSARLEVAGSTEGVRTIITVEPTFQRVAR